MPGVPAVESPFFDDLFDLGSADYAVASQLHEQGFAVIDFPDDEFDTLAERLIAGVTDRFDWELWRSHATDGMRVQDAWRFSPEVRRLATNQAVVDLLGRLYGRRAFPFQTLNFPVGTQQHFHTDAVHFSSRPERFMCGVWVALEDIGPENGPLVYYPGSHRWPIYTREHLGVGYSAETGDSQVVFEPLWERLVAKHGTKPAYFHARKGQALIWAANLLHGGAPHVDRARTRWSQVTHYFFDDCVYYTPLASNEPAGEVFIRRPENIEDGTIIEPSFLGDPLSGAFVGESVARRRGRPISFDDARYLALNPDVAEAGFPPREHYRLHGRFEGRRFE